MTRIMPLDEVIWRLGDALRSGKLTDWQRGFAASVARSLKRPNWNPSARQELCMRRVVDELRAPDPSYAGEIDLIDRDETTEMTG